MKTELYTRGFDDVFDMCFNYKEEQLPYLDYVALCEEAVIKQEVGVFYIVPTWRMILENFHLSPNYCEEYNKIGESLEKTNMSWEVLKEILELEVERCNRQFGSINNIAFAIEDIFKKMAEDKELEILENKNTEPAEKEEPVA